MRSRSFALGIFVTATLGPSVVWAADLRHGAQLFEPCVACDNDRPDATGPSLKGIVGRKAAARDDFRYSPAMQRAGFDWTPANLKAYLRQGERQPHAVLRHGQ
jgi:cytochrome c